MSGYPLKLRPNGTPCYQRPECLDRGYVDIQVFPLPGDGFVIMVWEPDASAPQPTEWYPTAAGANLGALEAAQTIPRSHIDLVVPAADEGGGEEAA